MSIDGLAAGAADYDGCGFDCGHWPTDVLASALTGLVYLPLALLCVLGLHRCGFDRWLVLSAALSGIFSIFIIEMTNLYFWNIHLYVGRLLNFIGVNRFVYELWPLLFVCFGVTFGFACWLRYRPSLSATDTSAFE